jgi:hypothetical protein
MPRDSNVKSSPKTTGPHTSEHYNAGAQAYHDGLAKDANPHPTGSSEATDWDMGFLCEELLGDDDED